MISNLIATILIVLSLGVTQPTMLPTKTTTVLGSRSFSLENRYATPSVNEVFKKNILLNIAYLEESVAKKSDINWDELEKPISYSFTLKPGEVFAYHDVVLPEFAGKVVKTTNAHFGPQEGFLSDGYLYGDGVCHFASLINWAAQDAGLEVLVTKNHNFAAIPDVPKEYGVSIYTNPNTGSGARNNLYITNTKDHDVELHIDYENGEVKVQVTETKAIQA